jgi:tripartite-type tricarboxylate transporter receptor subunit TctC
MSMQRAIALAVLLFSWSSARAADYPTRPVTIVVPFAAGGPSDVYARILAQRLQGALGQPFIVDNRPGASGILGAETVATSAPDGTTLLTITNTHTVNETLFTNKPFKLLTAFTPVTPINTSDLVLVTRPDLPVKTLADLIDLARAHPDDLSFASAGSGTPYHMAGELLKQMVHISMLHVPYKSSSTARIDVVGGHVDMMFDATTTMVGLVQAGKVRGIATTGPVRSDAFPNLPTVSEAGVPGYEALIWIGLVAPARTPAPIVDTLNTEIGKIQRDPAIRAAWAKDGATPVTMTPAAFGTFLDADIKKWAEVVKISGAKVDQ